MRYMHVYGVGSNGNLGTSVKLLMDEKYNQNKESVNGMSFERRTLDATINARILNVRLIMDSNRVSKIQRPHLFVESEVQDVWTDVSDRVNHVSFLPENRPKMDYYYPMNDDEIKGFVDAGMYRNSRFEALLQNLLELDQFEITNDIELQILEVIHDDEVTPVVLVQDVGQVFQKLDRTDNVDYTTFEDTLDRAIDMALQLEAEGVSTDALLGEDDLEAAVEVDVVIENVFDTESSRDITDEAIIQQIEEMDSEIDISEEIDMTQIFGQSTEEERIREMRDASNRGLSWDKESVREKDDLINDEDLFGDEEFDSLDDMFGSAEDMELYDEEVIEFDDDMIIEQEDEDEDELSF